MKLSLKQRLKQLIFGLLGKDPEGVVVTFLSGEESLARRMEAEVRELLPNRLHYSVHWTPASAGERWLELRRLFRGKRIAMAPVLFSAEPEFDAMRHAALCFAPTRILAYNSRLERHHLRARTWLASLLFLRGVPVDRIYLRPHFFKQQPPPAVAPLVLEGRPLSPHRPRVAVLTPYFPYPPAHGGAVRIFNLLREASKQFDIFLLAFTERGDPTEYQPVLDFCAQAVLVPKSTYREPRWASLVPPEVAEYRSPAMRRALERVRREYAIPVLQVEYTALAEYGGQILVEHDVTFDLFGQIHRREQTLSSWWNLWRWKRFEQRAVRRFPAVVTMSAKDSEILTGGRSPWTAPGPPARQKLIQPIPNGVDLARFQPEPETPGHRLLFIGSFRHFPNIHAYRFFTENVWPSLCARYPNIALTVVAGPDPLLHWSANTGTLAPRADERITLLGFVSDVRPLYVQANLVIVPTTVSAGTNLKVLEAMAMERAVVSTTSGCAGLGLEHGKSVWVADSPEEFAAGIARLLEDGALRGSLAANARRRAQEAFDWPHLGVAQAQLWRDSIDAEIEK